MAKLFLGTSGFSYRDWIGEFYPEDLLSNQWLEYYSEHFKTLELNSTFYRLFPEKTFFNWKKRVPDNFVFSFKANQRITHFRRLNIDDEIWQWFYQRVCLLENKLGVILFQLPPSMRKDEEKLLRFLKRFKAQTRFAFEFRHSSWFDNEIFRIMKAFNCSFVFHDAQKWAQPPFEITADFAYIRLHGVEEAYNYCYSQDQLKQWAERINRWLKQGLDVFAYFNNDVDCFAVKNAKELLELLS